MSAVRKQRVRTIRFQDCGQDFLEWDIDSDGTVIDSRPFQRRLWNGRIVLNPDVAVGEKVRLARPVGSGNPDKELTVKYPVVAVMHQRVDMSGPVCTGTCSTCNRCVTFERAVAIADEAMRGAIRWFCSPDDADEMYVPCNAAGETVCTLAEADRVIVEAVDWLRDRGLADVVSLPDDAGRYTCEMILLIDPDPPDEDETPPCVGERYRDALHDIHHNATEE